MERLWQGEAYPWASRTWTRWNSGHLPCIVPVLSPNYCLNCPFTKPSFLLLSSSCSPLSSCFRYELQIQRRRIGSIRPRSSGKHSQVPVQIPMNSAPLHHPTPGPLSGPTAQISAAVDLRRKAKASSAYRRATLCSFWPQAYPQNDGFRKVRPGYHKTEPPHCR
jgi:hypothetical protein